MDFITNVWPGLVDFGDGVSGARFERIRGETLAAAVWELEPGASGDYHFHHGTKELLVVLRGELTLRTQDEERTLGEGDLVVFPRGRDGAHGTENRSDAPVRYLMVAAHDTPDVIEYPDRGTLGVFALTPDNTGEPLSAFFHLGDAFDRDAPR